MLGELAGVGQGSQHVVGEVAEAEGDPAQVLGLFSIRGGWERRIVGVERLLALLQWVLLRHPYSKGLCVRARECLFAARYCEYYLQLAGLPCRRCLRVPRWGPADGERIDCPAGVLAAKA